MLPCVIPYFKVFVDETEPLTEVVGFHAYWDVFDTQKFGVFRTLRQVGSQTVDVKIATL